MKISFAMTYGIDIHHKKEIFEFDFNKLRNSIAKHMIVSFPTNAVLLLCF